MVEILWSGERAWLRSPLFTVAVLGLIALTLAGLHVVGGASIEQAWGYDFDAFYTGASMTLNGELIEAYDPVAFQAALFGSEDMYWMYPPHGAMLLAPLALLPYGASAALLLTALASVMFALGRLVFGDARGGNALLLLSVPGVFALMLGQVAPLFGALLVTALLIAPRRPLLAGALLALLTVKPQYGLLVPAFLLVRRDGRTIAAATIATLALAALSLAVFGLDAWAAWLASREGPASDFIFDALFASMPSVHHYARFYGASAEAAGWLQGGAVLIGAALIAATRTLPYRRHAALCLVTTCAVMPYLWFYDWLPIMAAVLLIAREPNRFGVPLAWLWCLWLSPLASEVAEPLLASDATVSLNLTLTQAINTVEIAAVWGTILALAYPALRTTALPVFAPLKRPMKASGPLSSPS